MEQFLNKMYELYMDMLQDINGNIRIEEKYDALLNIIFNNLELNYDKTSLRLKDESKIVTVVQAIEPHKFFNKLKELQNEEEE